MENLKIKFFQDHTKPYLVKGKKFKVKKLWVITMDDKILTAGKFSDILPRYTLISKHEKTNASSKQ